MPTSNCASHNFHDTNCKDAKMEKPKKGGEHFTSQEGMQCFKMCNSWCKSSNGHSNGRKFSTPHPKNNK